MRTGYATDIHINRDVDRIKLSQTQAKLFNKNEAQSMLNLRKPVVSEKSSSECLRILGTVFLAAGCHDDRQPTMSNYLSIHYTPTNADSAFVIEPAVVELRYSRLPSVP